MEENKEHAADDAKQSLNPSSTGETIAPAAMIFIPSIGGISHSPKEFSTATDMANGANVLLQTILKIDKE